MSMSGRLIFNDEEHREYKIATPLVNKPQRSRKNIEWMLMEDRKEAENEQQ